VITPGHKRALNRALHELRRPLQALLLFEDGTGGHVATASAASQRGLLELATSALQDLDCALNGKAPSRPTRRFSCREVVLACLERWGPPAAPGGGVRGFWVAGPPPLGGVAAPLSPGLDNQQ
jgi:hypothetical protein